jgi:hypothetical protein
MTRDVLDVLGIATLLTMLTVVNIIGRLHIEGGISLDAQAF